MTSIIVPESIGKTFNQMTVLRFEGYSSTPDKSKVPMVKCRCTCGNEKIVSLWDIRAGKTKTCGSNHVTYVDRTKPAFNNLYNHTYKSRALKSGLEFEIDVEAFRSLTQEYCHYCGSPPNNTMKRKTGKHVSVLKYNGLDRIDSTRGYTLENVVPCCGICNHAKHTMSYHDFTNWLTTVVNFRSRHLV